MNLLRCFPSQRNRSYDQTGPDGGIAGGEDFLHGALVVFVHEDIAAIAVLHAQLVE